MRIIKKLAVTLLCVIFTKMSYAQSKFSNRDTIIMYTKNLNLYNSQLHQNTDTLFGHNKSGRFEEQALTLIKDNSQFDILSMCHNRSTPNAVKLVRIGNNLFSINERCIVKIDNRTLDAFFESFDKPRHCDHYSHASHYSHYSSR